MSGKRYWKANRKQDRLGPVSMNPAARLLKLLETDLARLRPVAYHFNPWIAHPQTLNALGRVVRNTSLNDQMQRYESNKIVLLLAAVVLLAPGCSQIVGSGLDFEPLTEACHLQTQPQPQLFMAFQTNAATPIPESTAALRQLIDAFVTLGANGIIVRLFDPGMDSAPILTKKRLDFIRSAFAAHGIPDTAVFLQPIHGDVSRLVSPPLPSLGKLEVPFSILPIGLGERDRVVRKQKCMIIYTELCARGATATLSKQCKKAQQVLLSM